MSWKMNYRFVVYAAGAAGVTGESLVEVNATYTEDLGLNSAISSALAFVRRYQAIGIDAEATVFGKPTGTQDAGTVYTLTAGDQTEYTYAQLDAPGKGLMQRISAANSVAAAAASFDDDVAPDIPTQSGS